MTLLRSNHRPPDDPGTQRVVRILTERYGWAPDTQWTRRVNALAVAFDKLRSKQSIALYALAEFLGTLDADDHAARAMAQRSLERATAAYLGGSIRRPFAGMAIIEQLEHRFALDCSALRRAMNFAAGADDSVDPQRIGGDEIVAITDQDVRFGADFVAMIDRLVARIHHRSASPSPYSRGAVVSDVEMEAFGPAMVGTILALIGVELAARPTVPRVFEDAATAAWKSHCDELLGEDAVALICRRVRLVAGLDAAND